VAERHEAGWDLPAEVYQDAAAVMDSALRGDREAVVGAFDAAVDRGGVRGAYDVACCLAATMVGDTSGFAALDFPGIEQARYDARWVARFVSAYANSDHPTGEALFGAAMVDGQIDRGHPQTTRVRQLSLQPIVGGPWYRCSHD
jgi:hypothetical protein